jgi:hypothetical protein
MTMSILLVAAIRPELIGRIEDHQEAQREAEYWNRRCAQWTKAHGLAVWCLRAEELEGFCGRARRSRARRDDAGEVTSCHWHEVRGREKRVFDSHLIEVIGKHAQAHQDHRPCRSRAEALAKIARAGPGRGKKSSSEPRNLLCGF